MQKEKKSLWQENKYIIISFIAAAVTMLIIYICNGMVPFGEKTILRMDLYHQYGPMFAELYERVVNGDSLIYSWTSGLGSCFLGNYFNYLSSPISAIIMFFGHKNITEAIAVMILLKAALSSAAFTYYIKRSQKNQSFAVCAFSVLYAFCGYMLAYYWNVMWLDAMVLLPIVVLGIERIINYGKMRTFVTALAVSMFSNYYISFMLCIFSVIYFFHYYISNYSADSLVNVKFSKQKHGFISKLSNNRFFRSAFTFAVGALTAAGIMACVLIPVYKILTGCSATSGKFPTEAESYFSYFDFFANHLASVETTIRSSGEDVLPNVYCGILTIILAPLFFFTKSISKKEKLSTLVLLVLLYIGFNMNGLNYIWHAFHFVNDLPYRQSFMYSFVLVVMAYKVFVRLNEFTNRQLAAIGACLVTFIVMVEKITSKNVENTSILLSLLLVVLYVYVLTIFKDKRYKTASVAMLLLICCCSEAVMCDTSTVSITVDKAPYISDYDDFQAVKRALDEKENNGFYRMELTNLRTRMDPSWYYYNGVSIFSSMAYEKLSNLQHYLGMMGNEINSYTYNPQTPVYNMMFSLKYLVNNRYPDVLKTSPYYAETLSYNQFTAYENRLNLPLAYCVNSAVSTWATEDYITQWTAGGENPFVLQGDYFDKATGEGTPFVEIPVSDIIYTNAEPFFDKTAFSNFYDKTTDDVDASATYQIEAPVNGNIYIYFHVTGYDSKSATINTPSGTLTQSTSQNCILDIGYLKKGQIATVNIPFEQNTGTVKFCAYYIDTKTILTGYKKLMSNQFNITSFDETNIEGTVVAQEDCLLYTSIPYDEGWQVYIDGKKAGENEIVKIGGALLGINLTKGSHNIELKYIVPGLAAGVIISATVTALILLNFAFFSILKKKKKRLKAIAPFANISDDFNENVIIEIPEEADEKRQMEIVDSVHLNLFEGRLEDAYPPKREIIRPNKKTLKKEIIKPKKFDVTDVSNYDITE
ncbi:MAG: YfhO family protein [Acutalibacteraceae bacterium]